MSARVRVVVVLVAVILLAGLLWFGRNPRKLAPPSTKAAQDSGEAAAAKSANSDPAPRTGLPGLPDLPAPATVAEIAAAAAPPLVELALPPTPTEEPAFRAALADPAQPISFSYARFLIDRYLLSLPKDAPMPPDVAADVLFPVEFQARLGLPRGVRILAVDGRPTGVPGALSDAFRPGAGATWQIELELMGPDGALLKRALTLKH